MQTCLNKEDFSLKHTVSIMQIDLDLLYTWGAISKEFKKNDVIISEDEVAHFLLSGC